MGCGHGLLGVVSMRTLPKTTIKVSIKVGDACKPQQPIIMVVDFFLINNNNNNNNIMMIMSCFWSETVLCNYTISMSEPPYSIHLMQEVHWSLIPRVFVLFNLTSFQ